MTVLLSVLAHGLIAAPLASRYERALTRRSIDGGSGSARHESGPRVRDRDDPGHA